MYASDTGGPSGTAPAAPQAQLAAPQLGIGSKRRSRIVVISIALVIILAAVVIIGVSTHPAKTTTPYVPASLMQRSNALFGVPAAPAQYEYFNSSSSSSNVTPSSYYMAQYGFSFMQPVLQGSAVVPPSTSVHVPQQYSNITSPVMVGIFVQAAPTHAAAVSNYTTGIKIIQITFPGAAETSASVGSMSSMFSYKAYGLSMHTLLFVNNNYYVVLNVMGTPYLNQSYLTGIAARVNSLIPGASG